MRKKSFPPLPPLSPQVLSEIEKIDHAVQSSLQYCANATGHLSNPQRALRIVRTCIVMSLDKQLDYYLSLPNYDPMWIALVVRDTVESFIGLFPMFTRGDQFRGILLETATQHLSSRPSTEPLKLPPKPVLPQAPLSIGEHLDLLRSQSRMTVEELADEIGVEARSVYRHLSDKAVPRARQIAAYEKLFSKRLGKPINLETSVKRQ